MLPTFAAKLTGPSDPSATISEPVAPQPGTALWVVPIPSTETVEPVPAVTLIFTDWPAKSPSPNVLAPHVLWDELPPKTRVDVE